MIVRRGSRVLGQRSTYRAPVTVGGRRTCARWISAYASSSCSLWFEGARSAFAQCQCDGPGEPGPRRRSCAVSFGAGRPHCGTGKRPRWKSAVRRPGEYTPIGRAAAGGWTRASATKPTCKKLLLQLAGAPGSSGRERRTDYSHPPPSELTESLAADCLATTPRATAGEGPPSAHPPLGPPRAALGVGHAPRGCACLRLAGPRVVSAAETARRRQGEGPPAPSIAAGGCGRRLCSTASRLEGALAWRACTSTKVRQARRGGLGGSPRHVTQPAGGAVVPHPSPRRGPAKRR